MLVTALLVFCMLGAQTLHTGYLAGEGPTVQVATKPGLVLFSVIFHQTMRYPDCEEYVVEPGRSEYCRPS
jgi:hypothetical protein